MEIIGDVVLDPKRRPKHQNVYFVQAVELGLIKIGLTSDLPSRLRAIQGSSPDRIKLLGVMRCARWGASEKEVHQEFGHLRSHGEWFRPDPALTAWILMNADTTSKEIMLLQRGIDFPLGLPLAPGAREREARLCRNLHLGRIQRAPSA